jgi:hypothetical protein
MNANTVKVESGISIADGGPTVPTCIMIAAGNETKWENHLENSKHFILIDGQPLIQRTVHLLKEHSSNIYIVGKSDQYQIEGSTLIIPTHNPKNFDADKFLNSAHLWNPSGRTIILYGDVYFSDDAMHRIMNYDVRQWTLFARFGASKLTCKKYGECVAQSFFPSIFPSTLMRLTQLSTPIPKERFAGAAAGSTTGRWKESHLPSISAKADSLKSTTGQMISTIRTTLKPGSLSGACMDSLTREQTSNECIVPPLW